jgi:hypothetical protein
MKINRSTYFLIGVLLLALFMVITATTYESQKTSLVPIFAGGIILLLGSIQLVKELLEAKKVSTSTKTADAAQKTGSQSGWQQFIVYMWWVGFALMTYLIGFLISIPVLAFTFMKFHAHRNWLVSILTAVLTDIVTWGIFEAILQVQLFRGIFLGG